VSAVAAARAWGLVLVSSTLVASCLLTASPAAAGTACVPPPVAHRGDSARAPENTVPAFAKALAVGVRRLELDVRFTAGDVPVVMHDPTVDRTTNGAGDVSALTLEQLRALDAGSWFGKGYRDVKVPTLSEEPVTIRIPAGTRTGRTFKVKGKGASSSNGAGDLLVTVEVAVPQNPSDEERAAIEKLAAATTESPRSHLGV